MYTDFYGLSDRPFQLTPDARFWYESRTHKKAMAYLGYGLAQGEGFIVITGEVGAGKSTLVAHLMATIDRERLNAISLVSTQVDGDDMLRLAAQGLGLATERVEKAQLLDRIERELAAVAATGRRTLLIVDEAQGLSTSALEELRMLSNFTSQGRALIQIVLLGQPEFRDQLGLEGGLEQLRQRVIATHHLGAMEAEEVGPYMIHRLEVAGWQGRPAYDDAAFAAIHRHTGGVPRRVNLFATRLMLFASIEQIETIDDVAVETVAADMAADRPQPRKDSVLQFRSAHGAPPQARADALIDDDVEARLAAIEARLDDGPAEPLRDFALERRVSVVESRLEEQEAALRRVLTLLVDWVENGQQTPGYRTNAA
ncbi:MAG: ral secretion pathway protein [Alphaproteobacteria bacterium]|nr:ral secretion pathway protein [Alphaproteobacteria bacterium]